MPYSFARWSIRAFLAVDAGSENNAERALAFGMPFQLFSQKQNCFLDFIVHIMQTEKRVDRWRFCGIWSRYIRSDFISERRYPRQMLHKFRSRLHDLLAFFFAGFLVTGFARLVVGFAFGVSIVALGGSFNCLYRSDTSMRITSVRFATFRKNPSCKGFLNDSTIQSRRCSVTSDNLNPTNFKRGTVFPMTLAPIRIGIDARSGIYARPGKCIYAIRLTVPHLPIKARPTSRRESGRSGLCPCWVSLSAHHQSGRPRQACC